MFLRVPLRWQHMQNHPKPIKPSCKVKTKIPAAASSLLACLLFAASAHAFQATVTRVTDGDTLQVCPASSQPVTVRLYGIDAPEKRQPGGGDAAASLAAMLPVGASVDVVPKSRDQYGRAVAIVYRGDSCINGEMVALGHAWVYPRYCRERVCRAWKRMQRRAQAEQRGLWQQPENIHPWKWRKK